MTLSFLEDQKNDNDHVLRSNTRGRSKDSFLIGVCITDFSLEKRDCTLLKTVVPVLVVVHVCRTVDRVVGHPRPSLSGIGVPWVSLLGPTDGP